MERGEGGVPQELADTKKDGESGSVIVSIVELVPGIKPAVEESVEAPGDWYIDSFADNFSRGFHDPKPLEGQLDKAREELTENQSGRISFGTEMVMSEPQTYAMHQFKDKVVVDLGSGSGLTVYLMSCVAEARGYVAVDKYQTPDFGSGDDELKRMSAGIVSDWTDRDDVPMIPASAESQDMLSFLRRLPDASVSIFLSGTGIDVLKDFSYIEEVKREIERVLGPNDVLVSNGAFAPEGLIDDLRGKGKSVKVCRKGRDESPG